MKHILFKSRFSHSRKETDRNSIELFEDFLLFDTISFNIVGINHPLLFLIEQLGINKTEELLERKIIEFVTNIPLVAANLGPQENDDWNFKGVPPLISRVFTSKANSDPEYQIDETLKLISGLDRDRRRIIKKISLKQYKIPKPKFSSDALRLIIEAYKNDKLSLLGLNYNCEPENLPVNDRELLANLGYDVIETGILSQFNYKSKNNNRALLITKNSLDKLFNAIKVASNNADILKYESIPDLESLYKLKNYTLADAFILRDTSDAKKYRSWINEKTDELKDLSITKAYIDAIAKQNGFFNTNKGKLIKTLSIFALSSYIGLQLGDISGAVAGLSTGTVLNKAADLSIDLLDEYLLDGLLKGWNPRFYINEIRDQININAS